MDYGPLQHIGSGCWDSEPVSLATGNMRNEFTTMLLCLHMHRAWTQTEQPTYSILSLLPWAESVYQTLISPLPLSPINAIETRVLSMLFHIWHYKPAAKI